MKTRARSTVSGARARQGRRASSARSPEPERHVASSLQIAFAPLGEFEPLPTATSLVELLKATMHRVAERFTGRALAVREDGTPCLPEMRDAVCWSGWGAWFVECARAAGAVSRAERCDGDDVLKVAFERRRRIVGFPKGRYLNQEETLAAVREALAFAETWGRS